MIQPPAPLPFPKTGKFQPSNPVVGSPQVWSQRHLINTQKILNSHHLGTFKGFWNFMLGKRIKTKYLFFIINHNITANVRWVIAVSLLGPTSQMFILPTYWAGQNELGASQVMLVVKNPSANARDTRDMGQDDPLEESMVTHSSIPAWRILWTEEPGSLQSIGLQRVRHNQIDLAQKGYSLTPIIFVPMFYSQAQNKTQSTMWNWQISISFPLLCLHTHPPTFPFPHSSWSDPS